MTMNQTHTDTIAAFSDLQSQTLSIIRLSEPITNPTKPTDSDNANARTSDVSTSALSGSEPAPTAQSLTADLSHYRDLFSKLRFSYLEQVTKEKFLRAIVGDPPLVVDHAENVELEKQLVEIKQVLKMQKEDVARLVAELEAMGRELAGRYEDVEVKRELLGRLPGEIQGLEEGIRVMRGRNEGFLEAAGGGVGAMGMEGILGLTREKEREREEVEEMVKALEREIPAKERELERLEGELRSLEREKENAVEGARDAVRSRKVGGDVRDELEVRGRWLKGCEEGLRGLLGVEA
ncbi:MAG: hypothetical protein L6R41_001343 [Letrouitia leprolyta]|nr:MAG: hypothetical protein L6R41_001343 [Letrouitia leprolyta]